jgi:F-type H+-transporting ATPase subunit delta
MSAANRYALALFQLAEQAGQLLVLATPVAQLRAVLPSIATTLHNPRLTPAQRTAVATALAGAVQAPTLLANTLQVLAANRRLALLPEVLAHLQSLLDAAQGTSRVRVETATALTDVQRTKLANLLSTLLTTLADNKQVAKQAAKHVVLEDTVQPRLLGGFRTFVNGHVWDASVQGGLTRLHSHLRQAFKTTHG